MKKDTNDSKVINKGRESKTSNNDNQSNSKNNVIGNKKKDIRIVDTDFLVVGTGIAGLYTALKLSTLGKVTILTKEQLEDSNTQFAQGGIAAVLDKGDSWQLHMKDTLKAGAGLCNRKAVEVLVTEGPARVKELISLGTSFDLIEGELDLTREGAHSRRRILHARGDATGVEIRESLTRRIINKQNIELAENTFMIDLISTELDTEDFNLNSEYNAINFEHSDINTEYRAINFEDLNTRESAVSENHSEINLNNRYVCGILALNNNQPVIYKARAVIIASGGSSRVYANTSNPPVTTGDGIAAAYRIGADIMDMEFVQFHPTTFYNPEGASFLISESVRGEGAVLRNKSGRRFMPDYHHLADLAPRDVVARAIINEARKDNIPYVYLDVTELEDDYILKRFPTIFNTLKQYGVDMRKELIPVVPAAHYLMGGIKTDTYGHSNLKGLYACGEVACTGVHGANRLASNSLLEGLVFGHRIYESIKGQIEEGVFFAREIKLNIERLCSQLIYIENNCLDLERIDETNDNNEEFNIDHNSVNEYGESSFSQSSNIRKELRVLMTNKAGIEREEDHLIELISWIENWVRKYSKGTNLGLRGCELRNMLLNGLLITLAALSREESRGGHYRSDYPEPKKEWSRKHIIFNINYPEGKEYVLE